MYSSNMQNEIEVRFLEINKQQIVKKLLSLDAKDKGEVMLREIIFYDQDGTWKDNGRLIRLRTKGGKTTMTYKHHVAQAIDGAREVEFLVPDAALAEEFLASIGFAAFRRQEKKRHTLYLDDVTVDIDTWPQIPTYIELEGPSENHIKNVAASIGLDWNDAVFDNAGAVIENRYHIPIRSMRWFTFDRVE